MIFEGRLFSSGIFPRQSSETSRLPLTNHARPLLANQIFLTSPLLVPSQQGCPNKKMQKILVFFLPPLLVLRSTNMMVLLAGDQAPVPDLPLLELQGLLLPLPALPIRLRGRALFLPAQVFRCIWGYFGYFEHFWGILGILGYFGYFGYFLVILFFCAALDASRRQPRCSTRRRSCLLLSTFTPSPSPTGDHDDDDE